MDKFEISWTSLWRIFFMALIIAGLFVIKDILVILFMAIIISAALSSPVNFLERYKIPRVIGTIIVFLILLAVLSFLLYTIIPVSIIELKNLLTNLGSLEIPIIGALDASQLTEKIDTSFGNIANIIFSGGGSFIDVVTSIFGNIALIIATLVIAFYLTIDQYGVEKFIKAILPVNYENYVLGIYLKTKKKLGLWFEGQIILMIFIGALVFLGLLILGVDYSLILGILAGVLELIPYAGPIFAGALAFLLAISQSFTLGIYVIILFIIIQQIESNFMIPLVMKKTVGVSPVVVAIALLAGSQIAGIVGIILAVPTAVVIQEIIRDWEKRKIRGFDYVD